MANYVSDQASECCVAVGDFDGDGYDDLVRRRPDYGTIGRTGAIEVTYSGPVGLTREGKQIFHQDSPGIEGRVESADGFGTELAVGDFNGDGYDDLAIGNSSEDVGSILAAGAVNVIYGSRHGLSARLSPLADQIWDQNSDGIGGRAESLDVFGAALAAGDFNEDGYDDLAIGVPGEDVGALHSEFFGAGAVNVIYGSPNGLSAQGNQIWDQDSSGINGDAELNDRFGSALAVGDFNHDGYDDLAIGVPGENVGLISDAGAVNVIYGSSTGLSARSAQRDQIWDQNSNGIEGTAERDDRFGSVLTVGDFNDDDYDDLAIGVPNEDVGNIEDAGAVNIIYGSPSGLSASSGRSDQIWDQKSDGIEGKAEERDYFGTSLAAGDFNRDGYADLAIGVPNEDVPKENIGSISNAGAVNIIYGSREGLSGGLARADQIWDHNSVGLNGEEIRGVAQQSGFFGVGLAVGDIDGDFRDDLVVAGRQAGEETANVIFGRGGIGLDAYRNQLWGKDQFEIQLIFKDDNLTELQQRDVFAAAVRWSEIIVGDLLDATWNGKTVDDLVIEVSARNIDGPGGTLAEARSTHWRGTHHPIAATMTIDTSDLASPLPPPAPRPMPGPREGRDDYLPYPALTAADDANLTSDSPPSLYDVALHEIGHALGFESTTLGRMGLIDVVPGATFVHFTGAAATAAYNQIFGTSANWVPMELDGSHWREGTLGTELMTPVADGRMELSPITLGALANMGYWVYASAADVYPTGQVPRINPIPLQTVTQGDELSLQVTVSSGTGLEYSLDQGPRGATIDPRSGVFTWTPSAFQAPGIYTARVRVISPSALGDSQGFTIEVLPATTLLGAHLFYNNSAFDGNGAAVDTDDFAAIDATKAPLAFGESATFANVSGSEQGINGVFIDVDLPNDGDGIDAGDFTVQVGNSNLPDTWPQGPTPTAVGVLPGMGELGSDRIFITFADGAVVDTWLRIQVDANPSTGLSAERDVIFGNVRGDSGAAFLGQGQFFGRDAADLQSIGGYVFTAAGVIDRNDVAKNGTVDAFDLQVVSAAGGGGFQSNVINAITPILGAPGAARAAAVDKTVTDAVRFPPADGLGTSPISQDARVGGKDTNHRDLAFAAFGEDAGDPLAGSLIGSLTDGLASV